MVAQLLSEIDGVAELKDVMVIGSTNRPDLIDDALLRPGRLDKIIYVPYPDEESRKEIFMVHTKNMKLSDDVDIDELVRLTKGYTGADIAAVCREAGMNAIREAINENKDSPKPKKVSMTHFRKALEQVKASYTEEDQRHWQCMREKIGERG